jgi:hypothetical protein
MRRGNPLIYSAACRHDGRVAARGAGGRGSRITWRKAYLQFALFKNSVTSVSPQRKAT